jgi:hypothetical protein
MNISIRNSLYAVSVVLASLMLQACPSSGSSSDEDTTGSTVTLSAFEPVSEAERQTTTAAVSTVTANGTTTEIVGAVKIKWTNSEPNRSTVDISLSSDSGQSYPTIIATRAPDSGEFVWDTNLVDDCRTCRLRIVAQDVVGNRGAAADSAQGFIINNVPQVLGDARYNDPDSNGPDDGDTIIVPFDKQISLRTQIASEIFFFPVLGDNVGPFATVATGANPNDLVITFNGVIPFDGHLHVRDRFSTANLDFTAPSGLNIRDNLASGVVFAPDSGRTAAPVADGIDVGAGFAASGEPLGDTSTLSVALGDLNGDDCLDAAVGNDATFGTIKLNTKANNRCTGTFTFVPGDVGFFEDGARLALGNLDSDTDLDLIYVDLSAGVKFRLNDGSGSFAPATSLTIPGIGSFSDVSLGDVNGDTCLDLIAGNSTQPPQIWLNSKVGNTCRAAFAGPPVQISGSLSSTSLAVGDVNGDNCVDIVGNGQANQIWLNSKVSNDCQGAFSEPAIQLSGSGITVDIAIGDVNGDTCPDVIAGNSDQPNQVWLNSKGGNVCLGTFGDPPFQMSGASGTRSITLGDADSDGCLDVAGIGQSAQVWLNTKVNDSCRGTFSDPPVEQGTIPNTLSKGIAFGDADGDGDQDLFYDEVTTSNTPLDLHVNSLQTPERIFTFFGQTVGTSFFKPIALCDVNGDGGLDVAGDLDVDSEPSGINVAWLNLLDPDTGLPTGTFSDVAQPFTGPCTNSVSPDNVDVNDDRVPDRIITGSPASLVELGTVDPVNGTPTGRFLLGQSFGSTSDILVGDLNADSRPDLVIVNDRRVLLNDY